MPSGHFQVYVNVLINIKNILYISVYIAMQVNCQSSIYISNNHFFKS